METGVLASTVRLDGPASVGSEDSGAIVMAVVFEGKVGYAELRNGLVWREQVEARPRWRRDHTKTALGLRQARQ